jgi:endoglucanase
MEKMLLRGALCAALVTLAACGGSDPSATDAASASGNGSSSTSSSANGLVALTSSAYTAAPSSNAVVTIFRTGGTSGTASAGYTTVNGTATAGADYVGTSGVVTWSDGDTSPKSVVVPVMGHSSGKHFSIALTSVDGTADFGSPSAATVAISGLSASSTSSGVASSSSSGTGLFIAVQANRFVDRNGNTVQLRGVNASGLEAGSIEGAAHPWDYSNLTNSSNSQPDWSKVKAWKANAVRLPLNEAAWLGLTTTDLDGSTRKADPSGDYRATVTASVNAIVAQGLYVILDLHWTAPGNFSPVTQNPFMDADHSLAFWTSIATSFKGNPAVLFEAFNEPYLHPASNGDDGVFNNIPDANKAIRDGGISASYYMSLVNGNRTREPYTWTIVGYQAAIDAIRATGATNVIILGGQGYDNDESWWTQYPPSDSAGQLALTFHAYPSTWGYEVTGTSQQYNAAQSIAVLATPGVPVVFTEMGGPTGSGASTSFLTNVLSVLDSHSWGAMAWAWNPWGGSNTLLQNISNYTPTIGEGQVYQNWTMNHQ